MSKIYVPPIKCQGIKTKLVPTIEKIVRSVKYQRWIEPFFGSGVVGFNIRPKKAIFTDSNPHLINFYKSIQNGTINSASVRRFLGREGKILEETEGAHYYEIRKRFNEGKEPLDFLFLNRACFNGMIRFNSKGGFNVPFCKKPNRFAPAYITKIANQVENIQEIINRQEYDFVCQTFEQTLQDTQPDDLVYCDPPYIGRHVDYFDSWTEANEFSLHDLLTKRKSNFILSTWHSNDYRKNEYLNTLWHGLHVFTKAHFYHIGASEENRNPMLEALVTNFPFSSEVDMPLAEEEQGELFPDAAFALLATAEMRRGV